VQEEANMHMTQVFIIGSCLAGMMFECFSDICMMPSGFPCAQMNAYQMLQLIFTLFIAPALQRHLEPA